MSHPTYNGSNGNYSPASEPSNNAAALTATGAGGDAPAAFSTTSSGYEYDKERTDATQKTMRDEARPANEDLAKKFDSMYDAQTESKWGVERDSVAYKEKYQANLITMRDEFNLLGERISKFVEALQDTVKALEADEEDAETIQANLQQKLQAAALPSASSTTTGSGPYSYEAPTSSIPSINESDSQKG